MKVIRKLVNLTPHALNISAGGQSLEIPASGIVARCAQSNIVVGEVNGIPVTRQIFGEVVDLPEYEPNTLYIVSRLVASAKPERNDLLIPGALLRDEAGKVIGCDGFSVL